MKKENLPIEEAINAEIDFFRSRVYSSLRLSTFIPDLPIMKSITWILAERFNSIHVNYADIFNWLRFLDSNNKLKDLLYAIYFMLPNIPIEFDLSSYVKIKR